MTDIIHYQDFETADRVALERTTMPAFGADVAQRYLARRGLTSQCMQEALLDQYYRQQEARATSAALDVTSAADRVNGVVLDFEA